MAASFRFTSSSVTNYLYLLSFKCPIGFISNNNPNSHDLFQLYPGIYSSLIDGCLKITVNTGRNGGESNAACTGTLFQASNNFPVKIQPGQSLACVHEV